ncbi:MAG TPA: hypothetical protein VGO97_05050 [Solirubrobacterales bacterium]|nr:hypothetical protein [Solirubrobacterales bacterium]
MRKWRIQGWVDGELTGDIRPIGPGDSQDHDEIDAGESQFDAPPRWQEFWLDESGSAQVTA